MSSIFGGGSNIFIGSGATQGWVFTWSGAGWHGNVITQPQPLNTGALMSYTDPSVSLNSDGTYSFSYTVRNNGPNNTFYNLQTSAS
jgi:hypothetical protein